MNLDQFYKDIMEYNVSPSVFEFDPCPAQTPISNTSTSIYKDNSTSAFIMRKLGFQQPYKSPEEIERETQLRIEEEQRQAEEERKRWCDEFKNNHIKLTLSNIWGDLNKQQLKSIKSFLDTDDDRTYIYAGSKNRSECLNIDDVCAHVCKSRIKNNKLECDIEFDYSPVGLKMYNNCKNGYIPKLNLNTLLVYNEKDPTKQDMRFNCLEFI